MLGIEIQVLHDELCKAQVVLVRLAVRELDVLDYLMRPSLGPQIASKRVLVVLEQLLEPSLEAFS